VQPAIHAEQHGAAEKEMQQRFTQQSRHGVYQIGEVKARSCVVMGTFASICTLK
jgi:hypothetical protein